MDQIEARLSRHLDERPCFVDIYQSPGNVSLYSLAKSEPVAIIKPNRHQRMPSMSKIPRSRTESGLSIDLILHDLPLVDDAMEEHELIPAEEAEESSLHSLLELSRSSSIAPVGVDDPEAMTLDELDSLLGTDPNRKRSHLSCYSDDELIIPTGKRRRRKSFAGNNRKIEVKTETKTHAPSEPVSTANSPIIISKSSRVSKSPQEKLMHQLNRQGLVQERSKDAQKSSGQSQKPGSDEPEAEFFVFDSDNDSMISDEAEYSIVSGSEGRMTELESILPSSKLLELSSLRLVSPSKTPGKYLPVWMTVLDGVRVYISWFNSDGLAMGSRSSCPLLRRVDNDLVNATLLLHAAGLHTEQEKSIILSLERARVRCSDKVSPLYGVWIPLARAKALATTCCIVNKMRPFLTQTLKDSFMPKRDMNQSNDPENGIRRGHSASQTGSNHLSYVF